jgi:hypothetical protein
MIDLMTVSAFFLAVINDHNDGPLQPFCLYGVFGAIGEFEGC